MKSYVGTKIIQAEKMTYHNYLEEYREHDHDMGNDDREGYHVVYSNPDGDLYHSWSPKEVFEIAYREITQEEKDLIKDA